MVTCYLKIDSQTYCQLLRSDENVNQNLIEAFHCINSRVLFFKKESQIQTHNCWKLIYMLKKQKYNEFSSVSPTEIIQMQKGVEWKSNSNCWQE